MLYSSTLFIFDPPMQNTLYDYMELMKLIYETGNVCWKNLPIMLALCLMLFHVYYPQNYAGIIDTSLLKGCVFPHTYITRDVVSH